MKITHAAELPSRPGPPEYFTGEVEIQQLVQPAAPSRTQAAHVVFAAGARTAWHTHPLGQTIIITAGTGWVQREGGPIEVVEAGDVVTFPPGQRHWHGAAPTTPMSHIAIQEILDGRAADWLEQVSAAEYQR